MNRSTVATQRRSLRAWQRLVPGSLERELVYSIHDYWRLQSGRALDRAVSMLHLPEFLEPRPPLKNTFPIAIHLSGWADPTSRHLVSKASLRRANPDVVCRVQRWGKRSDVRRALGRRYARSGFSAEAYFREMPKEFFDLSAAGPAPLEGSTPEAERFIVEVLRFVRSPDHAGRITIDTVRVFDMSIGDPVGRLAMLAPEELTVTLNAAGEISLARRLSERFGHVPSMAEWCDRWSFIGRSDDPFSHPAKKTMHVSRPAGGDWSRPAEPAVPFPRMEPAPGRIIQSLPSTAPVLDYPRDHVTIDDCWIQNGGTVFTDTDVILLDRMADPRHERGDEVYIDLYGASSRGNSALLIQHPDSGRSYDRALFVGGRHDFNWYHWIIEYLPRLIDLDDEFDPDIPLLVSSQVPANGILALKTLSSRTVHRLPRHGRVRVERLSMAAPAMGAPDNYLARWRQILHADTGCLLRFRQSVLERVPDPPSLGPDRVFLRRTSKHRGLINQDALQRHAESVGYATVSLEKLDFSEQVSLFRSARRIVGPSGAAMANYLFSGPQTSVIDLISRHNVDSPLPALICAIGGARFSYLYGDPEMGLNDCRSLHQARHSAFTVRLADFERALAD